MSASDDPRSGDAPRIVGLRLRDVRSVWGPPVAVPLGRGLTVLVGANRSGTSNVAWAFAAALDPSLTFSPGRDVPRRRRGHAAPGATLQFGSGSEVSVHWDPVDGTRTTTGDVPSGHVVWAPIDRTATDLVAAAPLDLGDATVRNHLAAEVARVAQVVLPGIVEVAIDAAGRVTVRDDLGSEIAAPEIRAIVAVGLARALVDAGRAPAALVVEAPEVFLHPAGQETVADLLVAVSIETRTPVVTTTTSPFAIPRTSETTVVALARDVVGRTDVAGTALGDASQARLLGGLLRDAGLAAVLDRVSALPPSTRGVLIVEGGTDEAYLRQVAETLGRGDTLVDLAIRPAGGAMAAAAAAIVLRAESEVPVLVLLDNDAPGRRALETLVSRFGFERRREVMTYADVFEGGPQGVEAETLFDQGLLRRFVRERGPASSHGELRLPQGLPHLDLTSSGKSAYVGWLRTHARPEHLDRWRALLDLIDERFPDG
ncbi:hypothetical protein [Nitriliruptor alkaliphilus]|uniref:hypothetical protein n=1 Tax=Nitriliruptor alkaliphilus TaxID=427918 RepID=UPI000698B737|nr:hypothetical protein [Nitriliruptor alkaliphilus]